MGEKDYPPTAKADWQTNVGIGNGLNPDKIHHIGSEYTKLGEFLHERASRFLAAINGAQHDWKGKGFDAFHAEGERIANSVATNSTEGFQPYGSTISDHGTSAAQAKQVTANNAEYEYGTDNSAKADAVANALQNHFLAPGQDAFQELGYVPPPQAPNNSGSGVGGSFGGGVSGGGSGGPSPGGGATSPQHSETADDTFAGLNGSGDSPGDGQPSGDGKAAGGSPAGGAPESGGGAGSPSGGAAGGPDGGGPSGPPPGGFDPQAFGDPEGFASDDSAGSLSSGAGGVGYAGGIGGFGGGEQERRLGAKTGGGTGGQRFNVNIPKPSVPAGGGIGGGMGQMPVGAPHKKGDSERKAAAYLSNQANTSELLGSLPVVAQEVIGGEARSIRGAKRSADGGAQRDAAQGSPAEKQDEQKKTRAEKEQ